MYYGGNGADLTCGDRRLWRLAVDEKEVAKGAVKTAEAVVIWQVLLVAIAAAMFGRVFTAAHDGLRNGWKFVVEAGVAAISATIVVGAAVWIYPELRLEDGWHYVIFAAAGGAVGIAGLRIRDAGLEALGRWLGKGK